MTTDPRAGAEDAAWDAFYNQWGYLNIPPRLMEASFRAGYAAGIAHATRPAESEPFVCDLCGQPAVIGLRKNPGARLRRWCRDHFPEVERDA